MGVQFNQPSFEAIGYYKHFNSNRKSIFFSATICIIISQKILNELLTRYGNDTACNQSDTLNILRTNLLTWLRKTRLEVFKNATIE